ncbi:MAG TPA: 3-phosphoshikimate 1-carboxyvinyltransferase [Opitutales bacterium]|nr:3-phosphoshikimate 1-carboxyvinyltransferase [Opitutales bacterium]
MKDPHPITPFTKPVRGSVELPGSKSITNRALILAALCRDPVTLRGALFSRDTEIMVAALRKLGFKIHTSSRDKSIRVEGHGGMIPEAKADIHVGNAGTVARFLTAMLCLKKRGVYTLDGDEPMRARPMKGLLDALRALGAEIEFSGQPDHFPFVLHTHSLKGGVVEVDASASSQILSAMMIVAAWAKDRLEVRRAGQLVSEPFVRMTAKMIPRFSRGFVPDIDAPGFDQFYHVEPDATAASYFVALPLAAGGAAPGYQIMGLGENTDLQGDTGFLTVAQAVGLHVKKNAYHTEIAFSGTGRGVDQNFNPFSDTFLTLAAVAPLLQGPTRIVGIAHTRKQETDRVQAMATELKKLGQGVEEFEDGLVITPNLKKLKTLAAKGVKAKKRLSIETYEDHRVAMSFGILGCHDLLENGQPWLQIENPACCAKTFPDFFAVLENLRKESKRPGK